MGTVIKAAGVAAVAAGAFCAGCVTTVIAAVKDPDRFSDIVEEYRRILNEDETETETETN